MVHKTKNHPALEASHGAKHSSRNRLLSCHTGPQTLESSKLSEKSCFGPGHCSIKISFPVLNFLCAQVSQLLSSLISKMIEETPHVCSMSRTTGRPGSMFAMSRNPCYVMVLAMKKNGFPNAWCPRGQLVTFLQLLDTPDHIQVVTK